MSKMKEVAMCLDEVIDEVAGTCMRACKSIIKQELVLIGEEGWILTFTPDDSSVKPVKLVMLFTSIGKVLVMVATDKTTFFMKLYEPDSIRKEEIAFQVSQRLY